MTTRILPLLALLLAACDGAPSDKDPVDTSGGDETGDETGPVDADEDGYAEDVDCDDANAAIHPGADEVCDGVDNNCDEGVDDTSATDASPWYADVDGDGVGRPDDVVNACSAPQGYVAEGTDCDDTNAVMFPGNPELCDGFDNDCDLTVDEEPTDAPTWYADVDGDTFGDAATGVTGCEAPVGAVADGSDCDDADATSFPGAPELCDGVDHDCDGGVNDDDAIDPTTWYEDADGDGHGGAGVTMAACEQPPGYAADATDCDDGDPEVVRGCGGVAFDGTFGSTWESLENTLTGPYSLQSFHPSGTLLYNFYASEGQAYDPDADTWTYLSTAPAYRIWNSMAPSGGYLWGIFGDTVWQYDPSTDDWASVASYSGGDDYNATVADLSGHVYGHSSDGNIVIYDTATGTVSYAATGLGSQYETRMGYDATTESIYFGAFYTSNLYRYDIATGAVTAVTPIPEPQLNDIFCSDQAGHLYVAGDTYGTTMWQYTTATDTWSALPDLPSDHGNNSTCTVSEDGWLYVGTDSTSFYRLELY